MLCEFELRSSTSPTQDCLRRCNQFTAAISESTEIGLAVDVVDGPRCRTAPRQLFERWLEIASCGAARTQTILAVQCSPRRP
ncbi:hypothetical protein J6590_048629 [Homalodisca vitripennis]|nr:hypothetical protein J6590_048629 [Homalodisca vitripennis]